jgi:hypothetical protein
MILLLVQTILKYIGRKTVQALCAHLVDYGSIYYVAVWRRPATQTRVVNFASF